MEDQHKHKTKEWQEFEQLVARIEKDLCPKGAIVTVDEKIPDAVYGILRQVDVTIRYRVGSSNILIAIECRKRNTPQDISWIEQANTKKQSIKASEMILVSSNGFTEHAKQKADQLNISLRKISKIIPEKLLEKYTLNITENRHTQKTVALKFQSKTKVQEEYIKYVCNSDEFLKSRKAMMFWSAVDRQITLQELCNHFFKIGHKLNPGVKNIRHDHEVLTFKVPEGHIFINSPYGQINLEKFELTFDFIQKNTAITNHIKYQYTNENSDILSSTLEFEHTKLNGKLEKYYFKVSN
jgi:hypothetical protein